MNFLSIRGRAWSIVVIRGITVALELLALVLWAQSAGKVLLKVIVAFCFLSVVYECFAFRGLKAGSGEAEDERDRVLMWKASDQAMTYSQLLLAVLALGTVISMLYAGELSGASIMLVLIAISLPPLMKHSLFLYYEATDEGEYYE